MLYLPSIPLFKDIYGVNGKLFQVIKSMYNQIKVCINFNRENSLFYNCFQGLVQGEGLWRTAMHICWSHMP